MMRVAARLAQSRDAQAAPATPRGAVSPRASPLQPLDLFAGGGGRAGPSTPDSVDRSAAALRAARRQCDGNGGHETSAEHMAERLQQVPSVLSRSRPHTLGAEPGSADTPPCTGAARGRRAVSRSPAPDRSPDTSRGCTHSHCPAL